MASRPPGRNAPDLRGDHAGTRAGRVPDDPRLRVPRLTALEITYLDGAAVEAAALSDDEILDCIRGVLADQGHGQTVVEPRAHLFPRGANGHFNVLRGATPRHAGVKVVGDYVDNHLRGLPSELALLLLMDPETGVPVAILDATAITEIRTGAVTAIGAECLAPAEARTLGHIGARGTAYWNVRLLCRVLPCLEVIRVHSRRPESREEFARRLREDLGRDVRVTDSWEECVRGADVVVEASRLSEPQPLLRTAWISPGALVIPYGTVSAVELDLVDIMDKIVVDDWGQAGIGPLGALRAHVDSGRLSEANLHAELGQIVAGDRLGRERDGETSCSGTAGCRSPTSRSAKRCWPRHEPSGSGRSWPTVRRAGRAPSRESELRNHSGQRP